MMLSYDQSHYALGSLSRPSTRSSASIKSFTSMDSNNSGPPSPQHRRIWIVTGPAGCGKSTIAKHLAKQFNLPFLEGDEVSTQNLLALNANLTKILCVITFG